MGKKLLSLLLTLLMVITILPVTSKMVEADNTETLLTTITATGVEQASYSTENVATVSFSYTSGGSSAYLATWGWWGYGWIATVNAAKGYTITKCKFYDDADRTATDSEAPFVVETTEEDKTPRVNGTPIKADTSKGIKKIEVYGYVTPVPVTGVTLDPTSASLNVGGTETLTATVEPSNASDKTVKWSVNNTNVKLYTDENCTTEVGEDATSTLTVYAKGITVGNSTVTVTSNADSTKTATCEVTVAYPLWVGGVQVTSANAANITGSDTPVASYNAETNTLTLNGANISTVLSGRNYGINYEGNNALNIVLAGANTIKKTDSSFTYGIYSKNSAINISGTGSLDVYGFNYGIGAKGDITISSGTVNSIGTDSSGRGICSDGGDIYVEGGAVTARGNSSGIYSKNLTVTGGTLIAEGSAGTIGVGIIARITGFNPGTATISGGNVIAVGGNQAFQGNVINSIKGTGWTDIEGTAGKTDIAVSTEDRELTYKKVQFPAVHEHSFTYSASGATITATCANTDDNCDLPEVENKHIATLTIAAPALTTYGGSESAEATITDEHSIQGDAEVRYYKATKSGDTYTKTGDPLTEAPSDAGDYVAEITLGTGDNSATASIGYTIAKAKLTDVSVEQDGTLTYNKAAQTPAVTTSATAKGGQTVTFTYSMTETGEYGAMPTVTDASKYTFYYKASASNHEDASGTFTATVNKATAPEVVTPTLEAVTYDPNKTLANIELSGGWSWADNTVVPTVNNEGYQAELSVDDDNYDYSAVEGYDADTHMVIRTVAITVNKADSTAATVEKNDTTYDATEKALVTVTGSATGGKMNYVLGTDAETAPTEGWSEDIPSETNAGTYYVWYKVAGDDNHNDTEPVCVPVTISTVTLTVEAINQNIKVGGTVPDLSNPVLDTHYSVTGLKGEDTLTTNPTLTYKKNGEEVTPDNSKAGTYDIVISDADAGDNYTINYKDATLTVSNKDPQTIAVDDVTVTYGDTGKKVSAVVTEPATGGGKITYAVKDGSQEYIGIMIDTGELSIINVPEDNKAYVIVTAAETPDYALATKEVIITINPIDKSKLESAIEAATAYNNSIKDVSDFKKEAEEVKTLIETAQTALSEGRKQQEINDATTALNNALANNLKKLSDKLPETDKATLDNEETIKAANKALNALTADQKALVDNSVKAKIINDAALVVAIKEGKYFTFKGDNGQWTRGSSSTLPFTIKHTLTDDPGFDLGGNVTYRSFKGIKVDGKSVSEKTDGKLNYTYIPGSVKIDLLPDYLKTLSVGDHTLTVEFAGNMSATAKFKVLKESSSGGDTPYIPPKTGIE